MKKTLFFFALLCILLTEGPSLFAQTQVSNLQLTSMCSNQPPVQRRWRVRNPNAFPVAYTWEVYPNQQTGSGIAPSGDSYFFTNTIPGPNTTKIYWQNGQNQTVSTVKASGGVQCPPDPCAGAQVVCYRQGKRKDGGPVQSIRSNPLQSTGMPQNSDAQNVYNFFTLGFGGEMLLKMDTAVANGPGNDILLAETSWGPPTCNAYPEQAQVFASQDQSHFVFLGTVCQNGELDLGVLPWAKYFLIRDVSNPNRFTGSADGYDVDGIKCLNGAFADPQPIVYTQYASQAISFTQGACKNGTPVPANRSNTAYALGAPQNTTNNGDFLSLGFGGNVVLAFDYVLFDQPGPDLQVVEASGGNPSCASYPERVRVEVSFDGLTWKTLDTLCQDGTIDLNNSGPARYIRFTDISDPAASGFPGSADGYDVDGVVALYQTGYTCPVIANIGIAEQNSSVPGTGLNNITTGSGESEEVLYDAETDPTYFERDGEATVLTASGLLVQPNPVQDALTLVWPVQDASVAVEVYSANGRLIASLQAEGTAGQLVLETSRWEPGLYLIKTMVGQQPFVHKVVKE